LRGSIPILRVAGTLLVTLQTDLHDAVAEAFQEDLLSAIERQPVSGLIIEISALDMVDSYVARILTETGKMAHLMGAETVIVGMRPEVAVTLVRMGYSFGAVRTALNVDEGLELLGVKVSLGK
jgi:rsbT antagonist protein RsbS